MEGGKRAVLPNGTRIGDNKYEVLKCVHNKGMANIYMVKDAELSNVWCMKEIRTSEAGKNNIEYISLLNEANILRKLSHPAIPRITRIFRENDSLLIIMDWVEGVTLSKIIEERKRINQDLAVSWMRQLCNIMIYLHSSSPNKFPVFYRDMKSDNVILQGDGNIKLIDFGISVLMDKEVRYPESTVGTAGFAAPEQRKKDLPCDLRSDIFSMGMTMYHMLTGINPANYEKSKKKLQPIEVIAPDVSKALCRIVSKCIRKDPADRYQSCAELLYDLNNYEYMEDGYRSKARRKVRTVAIMAVVSAVLMLGSIIPYGLDKNQQDERYEHAVMVAEQSGRAKDYEEVLELRPYEISPYYGYITTLKEDGVFSEEEEVGLLHFLNPNLEALKKSKDFGRLAFEVGKLYWFYYPDSENAKTFSTRWFKDAIEGKYEVEKASVYYQLGMFKKNIMMSVVEAQDGGLYRNYWENLKKLREIETGDIVTLQINTSLAECLSGYAYNLKKDGVEYSDVQAVVRDLKDFVRSYPVSNESLESIRGLYEGLSETVSKLDERLEVVYSQGGGEG